jgi:hypothetical protein
MTYVSCYYHAFQGAQQVRTWNTTIKCYLISWHETFIFYFVLTYIIRMKKLRFVSVENEKRKDELLKTLTNIQFSIYFPLSLFTWIHSIGPRESFDWNREVS